MSIIYTLYPHTSVSKSKNTKKKLQVGLKGKNQEARDQQAPKLLVYSKVYTYLYVCNYFLPNDLDSVCVLGLEIALNYILFLEEE